VTVYILAGDVIKTYGMSVYYVINPESYVKSQTGHYEMPCGALNCEHMSCVLEAAEWNLTKSGNHRNRERAKKEKADITEFVEKSTINGIPARQVHVDLPFVCTEAFKIILIALLVASFLVMIPLYPQLIFYYVAALEVVIWVLRSIYYYKDGGLNPSRVKHW